MKKNISIIMVIFTISFLCGCASVGNKFNYQNRMNLELGITSKNDAIKLVGKPKETKTVSNKDGNYEILSYVYAYASPGGAAARVLFLEFKDNKLNAHIYNSGFEEDKTEFDFSKSKNLKVGQSSMDDVEQFLGKPSGKAICPSTLRDYSTKCQNATEIWSYLYTKKSQGYDTSTIKTKSIDISFDEKGIIADMETSQED
jgi:hypothetical protein